MKKRISFIICTLMLMLSIAGCGQSKEVSYDAGTLAQSCESIFQLIGSGYITEEDVTGLSEWNQGYLMAQVESQTGVKMEADDFATAIKGWEASVEECGTYVNHGEYEFKSSSTGVTVSTEAVFSERTANLEFSFNDELELEAFTVNAHFSTGEIMKKAGMNTILGMGTVFVVLIFMSFVISLFKYIPMLMNKKANKEKAKVVTAQPVTNIEESLKEQDDTELVAVIAAAIAAYEGTTTDDFVVRSIKRRKSNKWNS